MKAERNQDETVSFLNNVELQIHLLSQAVQKECCKNACYV